MVIAVRILVALPALLFLVQGAGWLMDPGGTAEQFGMPLLTGIGASTQIGDMASFFLGTGILMAVGQLPGKSDLLYAAALLIGGAAVWRTTAYLLGYADFAQQFIVMEILMTVVLIVGGRVLSKQVPG